MFAESLRSLIGSLEVPALSLRSLHAVSSRTYVSDGDPTSADPRFFVTLRAASEPEA